MTEENKEVVETKDEKDVVVSLSIESLKNIGAIVDKKPVPVQIKWNQNGKTLCVDAFVKKKTFKHIEKYLFGEQSTKDHCYEMISELIVDENGKSILTKEILKDCNEYFVDACSKVINDLSEKKS